MMLSPFSFWLWPLELWSQLLGKNELVQRQLSHNQLLMADAATRYRFLLSH